MSETYQAWRWVKSLTPQDIQIAITSYRQRFGVEPDGVMFNPATPEDAKQALQTAFDVCRENTMILPGEIWVFKSEQQMKLALDI